MLYDLVEIACVIAASDFSSLLGLYHVEVCARDRIEIAFGDHAIKGISKQLQISCIWSTGSIHCSEVEGAKVRSVVVKTTETHDHFCPFFVIGKFQK